jgi:hypothetical protein
MTVFLAAFALAVFPGATQAGIILNFTGPAQDPGDPANIVSSPNAVDAVITIDIDGAGVPSIASATSANTAITDLWTVTGTASNGFNSTVVLTLTAERAGSPDVIRQRFPNGIGVGGGNSGRIDNGTSTSGEMIHVDFDATDSALTGLQLSLVSVGMVNSNNIGPTIPDIGITDFDNALKTIPDIGPPGSAIPVTYAVPSPAALLGGSTGRISLSQPDPGDTGNAGYRLASIEFNVVPEPSSLLLLTLAISALVLGRKSA